MKTTIDVDRELAARAAEILGTGTLKETVNTALREVVAAAHRERLARKILDGTLAVPTKEEVRRLRAPKIPLGAVRLEDVLPERDSAA